MAPPTDAALDAELRGIVESLVTAMREVIMNELVAQARRAIAAPAPVRSQRSKLSSRRCSPRPIP